MKRPSHAHLKRGWAFGGCWGRQVGALLLLVERTGRRWEWRVQTEEGKYLFRRTERTRDAAMHMCEVAAGVA